MSLVKFENVSINYGAVQAVAGLSFEIKEGEYICLIGSNGSGKSTVIKGILGLESPTKGKITLNTDKKNVAYVPQVSSTSKKFPATVFEIVITGTQKKQKKLPFYTKGDIETANEAISLMGIEPLSKKRIDQLSGGQHQRVMLARAMCKDPKLLILDEPCANLDEQITESLSHLLKMLNREKNITVLMASHNMQAIRELSTRVIVLDKTLKFTGSLEEYDKFKMRDII